MSWHVIKRTTSFQAENYKKIKSLKKEFKLTLKIRKKLKQGRLKLFENGRSEKNLKILKIILALCQQSQKCTLTEIKPLTSAFFQIRPCLTNQNTKKEIWENLLISLPPSPISKKVYTLSQFQGGGDHFYCIWPTQLCKKKEAFVAELEQAKDIIDKWMIHCQWCETNAWWIRTMLGEGNAKVFR